MTDDIDLARGEGQTPQQVRAIENVQKEIATLRPAYNQAVERAKIVDREAITLMNRIGGEVERYKPGDPDNKAVYLMGVCHSLVSAFLQPYRVIEEFHQKEEQLKKLRNL